MDATRFDRLVRALAGKPSRRRVAGALSWLTLAGATYPLLDQQAGVAGKKKKKVTLCHEGQTISVSKKAKKKHLKHGDTLGACPASPPPNSPPTCASGNKPCGNTCIAEGNCCTDADCPAGSGTTCQGGTCACPVGQKPCQGACIPRGECCTDTDCDQYYLCIDGACIVGSGGCPANFDFCKGSTDGCLSPGCNCYATMQGAVRCGSAPSEPTCSQCTTDADCAELGYDPGAFCAKGSPPIGEPNPSCCLEEVGFCKNPCPGP